MTPYELEVLLWYYARGNDHPHLQENPPIWRPTINRFLKEDLIFENLLHASQCYLPTERSKVFVEVLLQTPLPEKRWVMPEGFRQNSVKPF